MKLVAETGAVIEQMSIDEVDLWEQARFAYPRPTHLLLNPPNSRQSTSIRVWPALSNHGYLWLNSRHEPSRVS
jgi:hypothetical protein